MEVVSYNIQFGRGLDGRIDLGRICRAIDGADLICLQEVESGWARSGNLDQAESIAALLPQYYWVYGASFDVDASVRDAQGRLVNRRRRYGDMILSRWPLLSMRNFNLDKSRDATKFNMYMGFIEAVIIADQKALRLYNIHAGYLQTAERLAQFDQLIRCYRRTPTEGGAWSGKPTINADDWSNQEAPPPMPESAIICGDFNCAPDSVEYAYLVRRTGLVDCWQLCDPDNMRSSTLRHGDSADIAITGKVDHVFVSPDLAQRVKRVEIDHQAEGSDHKPVRCYIDL